MIGELLVGLVRVFFMDEILNGLDSLMIYQIIMYMRYLIYVFEGIIVIFLFQFFFEIYELFDDVIFMFEGQIIYQGFCDEVFDFFLFLGFSCFERKNVVDFL